MVPVADPSPSPVVAGAAMKAVRLGEEALGADVPGTSADDPKPFSVWMEESPPPAAFGRPETA